MMVLVAALPATAEYSFSDPAARHTDQAIEFDGQGDMAAALKSFKAAVRLEDDRPLAERLANLGVCYMRMQRFDESIESMVEAAALAPQSDPATQEHVESNWQNLMSHLKYHGIALPAYPKAAGADEAAEIQDEAGADEDEDGWSEDEDGWSEEDYVESGVDVVNIRGLDVPPCARQPLSSPICCCANVHSSACLSKPARREAEEEAAEAPPPPPPLSAEALSVRRKIEAIYTERNPSKLDDLPALMEKYRGREAKLLRKIRRKYKIAEPRLPRQQYALHIPRVTAAELAANATLMSGHWPYVLTGEVDKWPAMDKWKDLDYLKRKIPKEWVDFYPRNMYKMGNKPYVQPYDEALPRFRQQTGESKYMQMRLSLGGWEELLPDLAPLPPEFWTEAEWIDDCMATPNGTRDYGAIDNFFRVNQWNFLLIGETGTGIFFHKDHLAAASWQAAVVGRKRWILCPYDQNHLLSEELFTFKPDYSSHMGKRAALAVSGLVQS